MRAMSDVPWPARRFKYPPTLAAVPTGASCQRLVLVDWQRRGRLLGWIRKPLAKPIICGGPLLLVPFARKVECVVCRQRAKRERMEARILKPPTTLMTLRVALHAAAVAGRIFGKRATS
jgi:hypothetical protein